MNNDIRSDILDITIPSTSSDGFLYYLHNFSITRIFFM